MGSSFRIVCVDNLGSVFQFGAIQLGVRFIRRSVAAASTASASIPSLAGSFAPAIVIAATQIVTSPLIGIDYIVCWSDIFRLSESCCATVSVDSIIFTSWVISSSVLSRSALASWSPLFIGVTFAASVSTSTP